MEARKKPRKGPRQVDLSCQRATAVITDYVNGRLEPSFERAFDRHLSVCPDCVAFLNTYKKAIQLAQSFLSQDPPAPSLRKIKSSLEKKVQRVSTS
jgi:anti-sigma factor RsiW